ncbi:MAG: nucleotidyl transferase AbiEii/AbiGii toxin family protein [Fibromonadales bacterium]|nr:nucleotidyl transferase AbiEii/AbiGii toxin family protein [Fibromonadales bacterium]
MISLEQVYNYFPPNLKNAQFFKKYMLKEYLQFMILDFLSTSSFVDRITFIGGTALRLKYGIDRFSEDLDFDCKDFSKDDFIKMTDSVLSFLEKAGLKVEPRDKENSNLKAFRRNIYFPEFLFNMKLSAHREERFLVKIEMEDQGFAYKRKMETISGCGFSFLFPMPDVSILFSMKLSALISRQKGRDFYDALFLRQFGEPDYAFLKYRVGVSSKTALRSKIANVLKSTNLEHKSRDFEHLLFNKQHVERVKNFKKLFKI